ncbi:hypothetical protein CR513_50199, partial [Mucuna pruriens]
MNLSRSSRGLMIIPIWLIFPKNMEVVILLMSLCSSNLHDKRPYRSEKIRRHEIHKEKPKRTPIELLKGDEGPIAYYNWEFKVEKNLECFDYEDTIKFKLITLGFKGYTLIWWNQISIHIRG